MRNDSIARPYACDSPVGEIEGRTFRNERATQEAADERADDAQDDGGAHTHRLLAGHDRASDEAGDEPDDDEDDDGSEHCGTPDGER
ncbi:MAG TPA: hypothetical protein VIM10_05885 [Actinopolymorphaceae bacterium]